MSVNLMCELNYSISQRCILYLSYKIHSLIQCNLISFVCLVNYSKLPNSAFVGALTKVPTITPSVRKLWCIGKKQ